MEFKGTKGKWFIERDKQFPQLHLIWSEDESIFTNGTLIARTCYAPLSEFNALLISKAPEMLDLLEELYEMFTDAPDMMGEYVDLYKNKLSRLIKSATELS